MGVPLTEAEERAVENILTASYDGWHLAVAGASKIPVLASTLDLSASAKAELQRLATEFSERQALLTSVGTFVAAVQGLGDVQERPGGLDVPLAFFQDPTDVRKTPFIAENLRDIKMLLPEIGASFKSKFGGFVEPKFQGIATNGANYRQTFDEQLADCSVGILLVLFDSDKHCPNCAEGGTANEARAAIQIAVDNGFHQVFAHCLDVSEIENLIPTEYWNLLPRRRRVRYGRSEQSIHRAMNADDDVWKYVDWKNGTRLRDLEQRDCCRQYWHEVAQHHIPSFRRECIDGGCQRDKDTCICTFTEKMGPHSARDIANAESFKKILGEPRPSIDTIPFRSVARTRLIDQLVPILIGSRSRAA